MWRMSRIRLLLGVAILHLGLGETRAEVKVHSDFPGGSGEVRSIDEESRLIVIDPADHPGKGWRCWWYVRIEGLEPGETWHLDVGEAPWATPDQPMLSEDGGETWKHGSPGQRDGKRIRYPLVAGEGSLLAAWGPPFLPSDGKALVEAMAEEAGSAEVFSLCTTREGRETPAIRFGSGSGRPLLWVQARQHAWESGASWVAKGFGEWLVSDDPAAVALRDAAEVVFVPVMDIDNVHRGAGGKNQSPQDHNRDWTASPHWNAVAAAQKEIGAAAGAGRLAAFIDLHNPGAGNRFPYFYVPPADILAEGARANLSRFLVLAKEEITGPLRFTGQTIESGEKYDPKAWKGISKNWVALLGTDAVSVTLETAWNTQASTAEGYEAVGRQLGKALGRLVE